MTATRKGGRGVGDLNKTCNTFPSCLCSVVSPSNRRHFCSLVLVAAVFVALKLLNSGYGIPFNTRNRLSIADPSNKQQTRSSSPPTRRRVKENQSCLNPRYWFEGQKESSSSGEKTKNTGQKPRMLFGLLNTAKYVKRDHGITAGDETSRRPVKKKYDHESSFVMKARYNCAGEQSKSSRIADYKLVLVRSAKANEEDSVVENEVPSEERGKNEITASAQEKQQQQQHLIENVSCDLEAFIVDDLNGPGGILANNMCDDDDDEEEEAEATPTVQHRKATAGAKRRTFNVVLHGNSYLRQIFESLACTYRHQITGVQLYADGPPMGLTDLRGRTGKIKLMEMGDAIRYFNYTVSVHGGGSVVGCHGSTDQQNARYYATDVKVPTTVAGCTDDVAMVEFQQTIRFYYVFRPFLYDNLTDVYTTKLGIHPGEVDYLVFNDNERQSYPWELRGMLRPGIYESALEWGMLETWKDILMRDLGFWPGCDNPGIHRPPDGHPCMPGLPDEEANLLLFLIFHHQQLQQRQQQAMRSDGGGSDGTINSSMHDNILGIKLTEADVKKNAGTWKRAFKFMKPFS